jgi:uncharacterized protein YggE
MKSILTAAALFLAVGTASASPAISITGTGKVTYRPDVAKVTAGIFSDANTANEAWKNNAELVKKVFALLKARGIDPRDFQTSGVNIQPRYSNPKDGEPVLVGYTVGYDLTITVRKLDELGSLLDDLVENGVNRRLGISFGCSDPEKLLDEARKQAVADARRKANLYATGVGARLGLVQSISEGSASLWRHQELALPMGVSVKSALQIAGGEQELSVSVTVTWGLNHDA